MGLWAQGQGQRIGIVGSRSIADRKMIFERMDALIAERGVSMIVSGGARGVDRLAEEYARERQIPFQVFYPELPARGARWCYTRACYARNKQIVENCDLLVAFVDKETGGTWNTIKQARSQGKEVIICEQRKN